MSTKQSTAGDDDVEIAAAQERLVEARKKHGVVETNTPAAAAFTARKIQERTETLAEILARGIGSAPMPVSSDDDRMYQLVKELIEARIPDAFHAHTTKGIQFPAVTWATLGGLRGPDSLLSLGGVLDESGKHLVGDAAVRELRRRMVAPKVILLGGTRAGKSCSAAAACHAEVMAGGERVRWVDADTLREPGAEDRALGAKSVYLDDVGGELYGAGEGTGMAAQRCEPVAAFVMRLARMSGKRITITTFMNFGDIARFYGAGVASRLYEGAEVIEIVRKDGK